MTTTQLGVFAKYWRPGQVKTRLGRAIGARNAARVYQECLAVVLKRWRGLADRQVLAYWPASRRTAFEELANGDWELEAQVDGDLGSRMRRYFSAAFAGGKQRVLLVGSDSPTLSSSVISAAFDSLDDYPVTLGPTDDGGYYLVGAKQHIPAIFADIPWSTPDVWNSTIHRLNNLKIAYFQLPRWHDLDDLHDLQRLASELSDSKDGDFSDLQAAIRRSMPSTA